MTASPIGPVVPVMTGKRNNERGRAGMKHGRATMPWGRHKGVRIRVVPDAYLSWLTSTPMLREKRWRWLRDSVIAELKFRGLRWDLAETDEPVSEYDEPVTVIPEPRADRKVRDREEFQ